MKRSSTRKTTVVADVCAAMETIAPTALAQEWDNVGLLAGDHEVAVRRVMLTIDLTGPVVEEAIRKKIDLIVSYHPPIFKPISSLCTPGAGMESLVFRCIREGVAIYSPHTALDAADGGTNDAIAQLCGIHQTEPLEYVDAPKNDQCKFVVFVPPQHLEKVADAIFEAGAGQIGDYSRCSFRTSGEGTFLGGKDTNPAVGQRGKMESVQEVRFESIVRTTDLPKVINAMRLVHPYEEPAFDVYPLQPEPVRGIGRCGKLSQTTTLEELARRLQVQTKAIGVQMVGRSEQPVDSVVIVAGAAGSLPFRTPLSDRHVIITGEIRHHDALTIGRYGCSAIALGHWASERPVLKPLAQRLAESLPGLSLSVSTADRDPLDALG
jgi:dinuclear metal center YbgI/SA1388 family protein